VTIRVALLTLGCARNEVDSDGLAGRLVAAGYEIAAEPGRADVVVVNTCGFIEAARAESVETLLAARESNAGPVIAVGCMAQRHGVELAAAMPELDAVLGFDDYPEIADRIAAVVQGHRPAVPAPGDRRRLLPLSPVARQQVARPAEPPRHRLDTGPVASVALASGCDRHCTFCAIPSFRGSFISRPAAAVMAEVQSLVATGVREVILVSENTTSYGKDLGNPRLLEGLLAELAGIDGLLRIRLAYLQPAEIRAELIEAMISTPRVANYFDLSFQHASPGVLRRMRRFGGAEAFLEIIDSIRDLAPADGIRSNVIVGFPGEAVDDLDVLLSFLVEARLDAIGVFGYSAEEGTEAAGFADALPEVEIASRVRTVSEVAEIVMAQRAQARVGEPGAVLLDSVGRRRGVDTNHVSADQGAHSGEGARRLLTAIGRAEHQGPEDSHTTITQPVGPSWAPGDLIDVRIVSSVGVDLVGAAMPADGSGRGSG